MTDLTAASMAPAVMRTAADVTVKPSSGVAMGTWSPDVSSHLPRWREVVVFANQ